MTTKFSMTRDVNGYNGFGLQLSTSNYSVTLSVSTDTTVTTPNDASVYLAVCGYSSGNDVWVAVNATAAVPVGNTFASTTSTLNRSGIQVNANDVLHFITADTGVAVSVTFYAIY